MDNLQKEIDDTIYMFKLFSKRLYVAYFLTPFEVSTGEKLLKKIANIEDFDLSEYSHEDKIKIDSFCSSAKQIIIKVMDEHEYRKELEYDEMMVARCLERFNRMAEKSDRKSQ